jgi:hypothetical protein
MPRRSPSNSGEASHSPRTDIEPLGAQQLPFELKGAEAAEAASGADDAVTRHGRIVALAHD